MHVCVCVHTDKCREIKKHRAAWEMETEREGRYGMGSGDRERGDTH